MKHLRTAIAAFLLTAGGVALAAVFNQFGPVNGILKGNAASPITTAATSTDIIGTFSGTCNAAAELRGDGSCTPAATGSVTSVGLTVPVGFSVTGSPVTGAGSLGITTALNGVLRGTGTGFATAASSNVISLWSGTCDATTFLRGDGSCLTPSGAVANPTALVGLTAINGVATTSLRSDGAPALNQGISPTWTGNHTFNLGWTSLDENFANRNTNGQYAGLAIANASNGTGNDALLSIASGASSGILRLDVAGSGRTSTILTGGPVGAQSVIYTAGNYPLIFGTNNNSRMQIDGTGAASFTGTVSLNATAPIEVLNATGAAANAKSTILRNPNGGFAVSSATDAALTTPVDNVILAGRTGITWSSLAFGNVTDNPTYTFLGTGLATFGGNIVAANPGATGVVGVASLSAAANEKNWLLRNTTGGFTISTATDAAPQTAAANGLILSRSGTTVTSANLTGTSVQANGESIVTSVNAFGRVRVAFAKISSSAPGVCAYTTNSGFSGGCVESGGTFTLTVSSSLSNNSACTVTPDNGGLGRMAASSASAASVSVTTYTAAGVATPFTFSLTCMSL